MRETKRRIEIFSFYDYRGIAEHLEKMAAKGWLIEKMESFGWTYRRIEPKKLHFELVYYPKASVFDPEPSDEQNEFYDFCAHTGWRIACSSGQTQIFYNERENPVPIETEAELELQAIHDSAKKSFFPSNLLLLAVAIFQLYLSFRSFRRNPIHYLSGSPVTGAVPIFLILALIYIVELTSYLRWYAKAKIAVGQGELPRGRSTSRFQQGALMVVGGIFLYDLFEMFVSKDFLLRWMGIIMILYPILVLVIVKGVKEFLKRKKIEKKLSFLVALLTAIILSFGMSAGLLTVMEYASSHGRFADKGEETYEFEGNTFVLHQDELPLTLEDLMEEDGEIYVKRCEERNSPLLAHYDISQQPRFDAPLFRELPDLHYTVTSFRTPFLYDFCKESLLHPRRPDWQERWEYRREDPAPWGANEVYRRYRFGEVAENSYLLCYDNTLVEIRFSWDPTAEQKRTVGEKLREY